MFATMIKMFSEIYCSFIDFQVEINKNNDKFL